MKWCPFVDEKGSTIHFRIYLRSFTATEQEVREYSHLTAKYKGSVQSTCNIQYINKECLSITSYIFKGYEVHFIIDAENSIKVFIFKLELRSVQGMHEIYPKIIFYYF